MYNNGQGVIQNYQTAMEWLTLAAKNGHPEAQDELDKMHNDMDI